MENILSANPNKTIREGFLIFDVLKKIHLPKGLSIYLQDGHQINFNSAQIHMSDPLVLDTDKDGLISAISLKDGKMLLSYTQTILNNHSYKNVTKMFERDRLIFCVNEFLILL